MTQYYDLSPKLKMCYREAQRERNPLKYAMSRLLGLQVRHDFALFPRRFYKTVEKFHADKDIDYCFLGAYRIDLETERNRAWVAEFVRECFGRSSYLQFTDKETIATHRPMGRFDHTLKRAGFVPKESPKSERNRFDEHYFRTLARSCFSLCPAGDQPWSMRFYESLMCRAIPIVNDYRETFRSDAESKLSYKYYLVSDLHEYREDWAEHNYELFLKYHTFEYSSWRYRLSFQTDNSWRRLAKAKPLW